MMSSLGVPYRDIQPFDECILGLNMRISPFVDSHKLTRRILKVSAALISAGAKISFIPVLKAMGPTLGPISIACNGFGFFVLEYWAARNAIDDFLSPKMQAQIDLTQTKRPGVRKYCRNAMVISIASIFALASQLTSALQGIKYNEDRCKVVAGIALLVAGALIPMRSLQLSVDHLRLRCQGSTEAKVAEVKAKMIDLVLANQGMFLQQKHKNKRDVVDEFEKIKSRYQFWDGSMKECMSNYISSLLADRSQPRTRVQTTVEKVFSYTGLATGSFLAGVFEYVSGNYIFYATKDLLLDNDYLAGSLATLAVTSTAYLFATSIARTTQRIFTTIGNTITGSETRNLGWQLRPKISFALTAIGLLVNLIAVAHTYEILGDFYNDDSSIKRKFFRDTTCLSLFFLLFTSTLDIINDVVTYCIAKGSDEEYQILALSSEFQQFASLIEKTPSSAFITFLLTSRDKLDNVSTAKMLDMTTEELENFTSILESGGALLNRLKVTLEEVGAIANKLDYAQIQ